MTAEILLVCLSLAVAVIAAGLSVLILAAFGSAGWLVIAAVAVTGALAWRFASARLAARQGWLRDDLRDDWTAG